MTRATKKPLPTCHHYCNTLNCWTCIRRFWKWAENHTQGREHPRSKPGNGDVDKLSIHGGLRSCTTVSFYEAAAVNPPNKKQKAP